MASIKITQLTDIGANIAASTLVPVVDMSGTPTTEKANLQIIGNLILNGAGNTFPAAAKVNIANTSSNTQVLFNDAGNIAGNANLIFNKTTGNLTTPNNFSVLGSRLNLGANAATINLLAPTLVAANSNPAYVQASLFNTSDTGSSDFIAYGSNGSDEQGWNDIGFAGQLFDDPNYTITGPGDGYVFLQTYGSNNYGGNLVLATGENSVDGDIIFATGGFTLGQDKARITGTGKLLVGANASVDSSLLQVNGNITVGNITAPSVSTVSTFSINAGTQTWGFGSDGILSFPGAGGASWTIGNSDQAGWFEIASTSAVTIHTDIGNGEAHFLFDVGGEFTSPGNVHVLGDVLTVGPGSDSVVLTAPVLIAGTNNPVYVQSAIYNFNSAGSSDLATYGADGTDSEAWTDLGFTGNTFADPTYTITGPGDGYVFVQTYANGSLGGNLVLATGNNSAVGDIIFATGGFANTDAKARLTGAGKLLVGYQTSQDASLIQANGNISASSFMISGGTELGQIEGANTVGFYNASANTEFLIELGSSNTWSFSGNTGSTGFPLLATQRGDNPSGTITGSTIKIGDGTYEAIITTPDGDPLGGQSSQRLVINPGMGAANTSGEGGDIYLWAGRGGNGDQANVISGGSGGDIKIRGGQGGGVNGAGGYIRIEAGDGAYGAPGNSGQAGYVEITGGQGGADLQGGYVEITGGQGPFSGGVANLVGGVGVAGPGGSVNIAGGTSGNGLAEYGNVNITAGASTWIFDNTGTLTVPGSITATPVAYANLTAVAGARAFINNANLVAAGNFGAQVGGGGSNTVPVWSDGTSWYIG